MRKCATPNGKRSSLNEYATHARSGRLQMKQQHWSSVRRITKDWLKHEKAYW